MEQIENNVSAMEGREATEASLINNKEIIIIYQFLKIISVTISTCNKGKISS